MDDSESVVPVDGSRSNDAGDRKGFFGTLEDDDPEIQLLVVIDTSTENEGALFEAQSLVTTKGFGIVKGFGVIDGASC